jgi:hypothetical protein
MLLTIRNWCVSLPAGVQQREVLLVGLHRQDQALLRHRQELGLELAQQHVGALDQRGHLVEQRVVVDGLRPSAAPRRPSWRTISARRSAKLAITAPCSRSWRRSCRRARADPGVTAPPRSGGPACCGPAFRPSALTGTTSHRAAPPAMRRAHEVTCSSRRPAGRSSPWGSAAWPALSSSAFCRPAASVAPAPRLSRNSASALPSGALELRHGAASAPRRPASSAARGWAGRRRPAHRHRHQLLLHRRSAAWAATPVMCTASRRGEARRDGAARQRPGPGPSGCGQALAKASPSFFSALGGSSSTNSSTSRFFGGAHLRPPSWLRSLRRQHFVGPGLRGAIGKPSRARLSR